LFAEYDAEEQFDEDELVQRLTEFREGLREKYEVGPTAKEQLETAIQDEDYEAAARLRDQLSKRTGENYGA
jgi:excinuclease UvrABC nuclease subunit